MSMFKEKKPYSAVTVAVENLTSETYEEEDFSGIPELVEVIKLQSSGPTEAARAIRKKLKYGNVHRQIRALVILDGLIQNAGPRFQRAFADEPLLERLRVCGSSDLSDPDVKKKCGELFREWSQYSQTAGLERISRLHKEMPKRKVQVTQERSKVLRETEANPFDADEDEEVAKPAHKHSSSGGPSSTDIFFQQGATSYGLPPALPQARHKHSGSGSGSGLFGSSSKDKKKDKSSKGGKQRKPFNLEAEKEQMKSVIAESSIAATNLMNSLQSINREKERISENNLAVERFESCKLLRRKLLRYIHHVEHEQWLGGLLHANDELVHALMSYEQMDRSIDADSDSDDELAEQAHLYRMATMKGKESTSPPPDVSGLSISSAPPRPRAASKPSDSPPPAQPPRPAAAAPLKSPGSERDDDDDPFGDANVVDTPAIEQGEPGWGRI